MLNTVVNPMLNTLGGEGKRGTQLLQFGGTLNSMGATIVPVLVGYLMGDVAKATISDANPALFLAIGIFVLAFIVLYSMSIPEPHIVAEKSTEKNTHSPLSLYKSKVIAIPFLRITKTCSLSRSILYNIIYICFF